MGTIYTPCYRFAHLSVDVVVGEKPSTLQFSKLEETQSERARKKNGVELISWLKVITVLMFVLIEILMITNPYLVLWAALPFITLLFYVCIKYVNRLICQKKYVSLHIINNE